MANNRVNFSSKTIDILAKRVGFLCSNPNCKRHTIGPNANEEKTTSIGVAAHITAAAPLGPRYDANLTPDQRIHIDNGIWLCYNCSTIIDKDSGMYPVELLVQWKSDAEADMSHLDGDQGSYPSNQIQDCWPNRLVQTSIARVQ